MAEIENIDKQNITQEIKVPKIPGLLDNSLVRWTVFFIIACAVVTVGYSIYFFNQHADPLEISIFSGILYKPDTPQKIIVQLRNGKDNLPIANQTVKLSIKENDKKFSPLPDVNTDADGLSLVTLPARSEGRWLLKAQAGPAFAEKRFTVKSVRSNMLIPPSPEKKHDDSAITTDKSFYSPGDTVTVKYKSRKLPDNLNFSASASIRVPIKVRVRRYWRSSWETKIVTRQMHLADIRKNADKSGTTSFQFKLPKKFTGINLRKEDTDIAIVINVDAVQRTVSSRPLRIACIPVYGDALPGIPNQIYVFTGDPDGKPASTTVRVNNQTASTNQYGLAEVTLPSGVMKVDLRAKGMEPKSLYIPHNTSPYAFILKADKAFYKNADTMHLELDTVTTGGNAYVSIQAGSYQTALFPVKLDAKKQNFSWKIPDGISGIIQVHAYRLLPTSEVIEAMQVVQAGPLKYRYNLDPRFLFQENIFNKSFRSRARTILISSNALKNAFTDDCVNLSRISTTDLSRASSPRYSDRENRLTGKKAQYSYKLLAYIFMLCLALAIILALPDMVIIGSLNPVSDCIIVPEEPVETIRRDLRNSTAIMFTGILCTCFFQIYSAAAKLEFIKKNYYISVIIINAALILVLLIILRQLIISRKRILSTILSYKTLNWKIISLCNIPVFIYTLYIITAIAACFAMLYFPQKRGFMAVPIIFVPLSLIPIYGLLLLRSQVSTHDKFDLKMYMRPGLGGGIGNRRRSFLNLWVFGSLFLNAPLFIVYILVAIAVLAMFLPLVKVIEKLS